MRRACLGVFWLFAVLYAAALGLLLVGTYGLFGASRDPLAGVFLIPLGLPWVLMLDDAPDEALPWVGVLSPMVNLVLIGLLCRLARGGRRAR